MSSATYIRCQSERHLMKDSSGTLLHAGLPESSREMLSRYADTVQTVYLDPPFNTGKRFEMRARVGEKGYRTGSPALTMTAYDDKWESREAYVEMMRCALETARALLCREGTVFLHIDARMHAQMRLLMDDIFGENNFLNEIVWSYQTGGRARSYFPRKHDTILFYAKTRAYYFNIKAVPVARSESRSNHMRRGVDEDGRTYRAINSGGREYRYYDDEPAYPGDVWNDVSHLQQKDPQRTGYDTQKPLRLLERIVSCSTQEGDTVCDLFCGSGTTAVAAARLGRRFLCADKSMLAVSATARRLLLLGDRRREGPGFEVEAECGPDDCQVDAEVFPAISSYTVRLLGFDSPDARAAGIEGLDAVDMWSAGFLQGDSYRGLVKSVRTSASPTLARSLEMPVYLGEPCVMIVDVWGKRRFYLPKRRY